MNNITTLIIMIVSYCGINQAFVSNINHRRTARAVSVVVGLLYLCVAGVVGLLYINSGYDWFVIYAALLTASACVLGLYVWKLVKNWRYIDKTCFVIFILYFALILWVTIVMRIGSEEYISVRSAPLDRVIRALKTGDWELFKHFLLNAAMFLPFGFLMKLMDTDRSNGWGNSLLLGAMSSTVIETLQMLMRIGEWDIDDIIANTMGCVVGFLIAMFLVRVSRNWSISSK